MYETPNTGMELDGNDDSVSYAGSPLSLLHYSSACNYMNYWSPDGNCPDPYGMIKTYIENYNQGIKQKHDDPYKDYNQGMKLAKHYTLSGAGLFALACVVVAVFGTLSKPKNMIRVKAASKHIKGRLREKRDKLRTKMKKKNTKKTTKKAKLSIVDTDEFVDEPNSSDDDRVLATRSTVKDNDDEISV